MKSFDVIALGARDYYQIPIALHQKNCLGYLITDFYGLTYIKKSSRFDSRLPKEKVVSIYFIFALKIIFLLFIRNINEKIDFIFGFVSGCINFFTGNNAIVYSYYLNGFLFFYNFFKIKPKKIICFHVHPDYDFEFTSLKKDSENFYKHYSIKLKEYLNLKPQINSNYYYKNLRKVNTVLCASQFIKKQLLSHNIKKITVIPYGSKYEFNRFVEKKNNINPSRRKTRIITIARLTQSKGLHWYFKVFEKLNTLTKEKLEWVIISNKIDPEILGLIPKGVKLLTNLTNEDLKMYLESSDLFLLPSLYEGFGLVYLEAASLGLPIAFTENSGAADFCKNGKNGLLLKFNEISIFNFFNTCAYDFRKVNEMKKNCLNLNRLPNWRNFREEIVNVCELCK
jgi:glycosyltransferase involved in cell wall biosynthesis